MMCEGCRILYIIMLWIVVVVVVVGRHTRIIGTRVMSIVTAPSAVILNPLRHRRVCYDI